MLSSGAAQFDSHADCQQQTIGPEGTTSLRVSGDHELCVHVCECVFTSTHYSCWGMVCLELQPYVQSQEISVIHVCLSVCVLTLCHH